MKSYKYVDGLLRILSLGLFLMVNSIAIASDEYRDLDKQTQTLKAAALELNQELNFFKEEALYPASSQLAVFLSMDIRGSFSLDSLQLMLDGKNVISRLYNADEIDALLQGGVQKIFIGNLTPGEHQLAAVMTGTGKRGRAYRGEAQVDVVEDKGAQYFEFVISDHENKRQPDFFVREWE